MPASTKPQRDELGNLRIGEITVKGKIFDYFVTEDGEFLIHNERTTVNASSLDGLKKKLLRIVAQNTDKIRVPILLFRPERVDKWTHRKDLRRNAFTWTTADVRGLHGGNDNALIEMPNGDREQYSEWAHGEAFRGDTPEDVQRQLVGIYLQIMRLYKEQDEIEHKWKVQPEKIAKEAVEQVVGEVS